MLSGAFIGAVMSILAGLMQATPDATGTAIARPLGKAEFFSASDSYFQVFEFFGKPPHTWAHANRMVRGYRVEGRDGRLAHVPDLETHFFLLSHFQLMNEQRMWIGLYVDCGERITTHWVEGPALDAQPFRAWIDTAPGTIRGLCRTHRSSGRPVPVFYEPSEFGVRWQAMAPGGNLKYMMVEFPAPDGQSEQSVD